MSSDSPEPTNVRPTLRERRDELDAEIAHREASQVDAYNEQLEQLQSAVLTFAEQHGGWTDSQRKNVASITVNDAVTVEFTPPPSPTSPDTSTSTITPACTAGSTAHYRAQTACSD